MKAVTQSFTRDRLEELAKNPSNIVYEYTHDTPEDERYVLSPEDQFRVFQGMYRAFDAGASSNPTASDEALREKILSSSDLARRFQHAYPKVFASAMQRGKDHDDVVRIDKVRKITQAAILERWKADGTEEEKKARVMEAAMAISLREATPEEMASGPRADLAEHPELRALKPLDPGVFGECTVRQ